MAHNYHTLFSYSLQLEGIHKYILLVAYSNKLVERGTLFIAYYIMLPSSASASSSTLTEISLVSTSSHHPQCYISRKSSLLRQVPIQFQHQLTLKQILTQFFTLTELGTTLASACFSM